MFRMVSVSNHKSGNYILLILGNKNWEWWRGDARFWRRVAMITHDRTTPKIVVFSMPFYIRKPHLI